MHPAIVCGIVSLPDIFAKVYAAQFFSCLEQLEKTLPSFFLQRALLQWQFLNRLLVHPFITLFSTPPQRPEVLGSLSNDDSNANENGKKQ